MNDPDVMLGLDAGFLEALHGEERGDDALVVVLDAPTVDLVSFDANLVWTRSPLACIQRSGSLSSRDAGRLAR